MAGLITIRDAIRDFLRKYDEIISPVFRFFASLILFISINSLYGYSDLTNKGIVVFLLAVICSLVTSPIVVLIAGAVVTLNCFMVSKEIGIVFVVLFIIMYLLYMRLFPKCSWVLFLVPILYICHLQFATPLIVLVFAGAAGFIPAGFGVIMYQFAKCVESLDGMLATATKASDVDIYGFFIDNIFKNKALIITAIVFAIVILVSYFIYRLPFNYSWYVAIAVAGLMNILLFLVCSGMVEEGISVGEVAIGSLLGIIVAAICQVCKSLVDYSRKQKVQFEDDDYYYYVTAIPKFGTPSDEKDIKKKVAAGRPARRPEGRPEGRQAERPSERPEGRPARRPEERPEGRPTRPAR